MNYRLENTITQTQRFRMERKSARGERSSQLFTNRDSRNGSYSIPRFRCKLSAPD